MIVGFSKLFADIIHSTVWREPMHVKVVWITMLAMADRHGQVFASIPGLADSAKVSLDECLESLEIFSSPDKYSRTKDYEGRRIIEIDGGWLLLNYEKFRERRDDEEQRIQTRDRVRRHREKAKALGNIVTEVVTETQSNDITEADTEAEAKSIGNAWTGKPREESPNHPSSPESDSSAAEIFVGTVLAGVTKELGLTKLAVSAQRDWTNYATLAFENHFTAEQFLECMRLLRGQTWRTSAVKPATVFENLPELKKLRLEGKQNGSTEKLPTLAEKLADDQANRQNLRKAPITV